MTAEIRTSSSPEDTERIAHALAARLGMTPADFEPTHVYRVGFRR